jgi:sensor histidine kinase YesM
LLHSTGEKKLHISFTRNSKTIFCTIEDNGIGIQASEKLKQQHKNPHRSVGLDNLRNRIKIINEKYGMHCSLSITDLKHMTQDEHGTRAILQFQIMNL